MMGGEGVQGKETASTAIWVTPSATPDQWQTVYTENAQMIRHYQGFGYDVWLKTHKPTQQSGKTNHRADQRLDPIYYAL